MKIPLAKKYPGIAVISTLALGAPGLAYLSGDLVFFQRFFGEVNLWLVYMVIGVAGVMAATLLQSKGWFMIYKPERWKSLWRYLALAFFLSINAILIDLKVMLPADMNIPFPNSLMFYPSINFLVQIIFHILPLTALLLMLKLIPPQKSQEKFIWIVIAVVALLEPIYHMLDMRTLGAYSLQWVILTGINIYLINFFELLIFKRYDFVAMFLFRLLFYLIWHIIWGYFRLGILFT